MGSKKVIGEGVFKSTVIKLILVGGKIFMVKKF